MWKIDIVHVIALFYVVIMMQENLTIDFQFKFNGIKTKSYRTNIVTTSGGADWYWIERVENSMEVIGFLIKSGLFVSK